MLKIMFKAPLLMWLVPCSLLSSSGTVNAVLAFFPGNAYQLALDWTLVVSGTGSWVKDAELVRRH